MQDGKEGTRKDEEREIDESCVDGMVGGVNWRSGRKDMERRGIRFCIGRGCGIGRFEWGEGEEVSQRSVVREVGLVCRYEGCTARHVRTIGVWLCIRRGCIERQKREWHSAAVDMVFGWRGGWGGEVVGIRESGICGSWITVGKYARHDRRCLGGRGWVRGRVRECDVDLRASGVGD